MRVVNVEYIRLYMITSIRIYLFLLITLFTVQNIVAQLPQKSHLSAWLSADSVTFSSSNFVSKIKDLSGKGNDALQSNSLLQPKQNSSTQLNNHNVITFDGASDYMTFSAPYSNFFTMFVIAKKNGGSGYQHVIEPTSGGNAQIAYIDGGKFTWQGSFTSGVFNTQSYQIMCVARKSDSSFFYLNKNLNVASNVVPNISGSGWVIGTYNGFPVEYFNGDIAEIILYDTLLSKAVMDTVSDYLVNKYAPSVNLKTDQLKNFCFQQLDAGAQFKSYLWTTNDTTQKITPTQNGKYWVRVKNIFGLISSDTIVVQLAQPNLLKDSANCNGSPIKWDIGLNRYYYDFLWSDGSIDSFLNITQPGQYHCIITDSVGCMYKTDTFNIAPNNFPSTISLGNDTIFCSGNTITLKKGASQVKSYLWIGGTTASFLTIPSSGQYMVTVTDNNGCTARDTINVTISGIAPKAGFSYISPGCKGDSISFTDLSIPPGGNTITGRLWGFGDAQNSSLANPKHLYLSPNDTGVFNVKLSVTTNVGCSKDTTIRLHVYPKPFVFFSNSLACSGDNVGFTNLSDLRGYAAQSYSWNFGDPASGANNTSSVASPGHKFTAPGVNNVKFVITNNKGCADSLVKSVTIQPAPTAQFSTSLTCEKQKIFFTDNSSIISPSVIQTWKTDFGDASSSTIKNPNHTYNIAWTYIVKYIVGANNGCSDTVIKPITIYNTPLAKIGLMGPFCVNDSISFIDSSIVNSSSLNAWSWTIDGTQNFTVQDPKSPITNTGSHSAKLVVTSLEGCKDSTTRSFTINALPTVGFSFSPTYGDPPLVVSFTNLSAAGTSAWDFGDTFQSTLSSPTHTYQDSGTYVISLLLTDNNGCVNSTSQTFQLQYAKYDIALLEVQADIDADNFLNIKVNFGNASTRPLTAADFIVDIDGDNGFKESWAGNLSIGGISSYTFKTSPRLNTTSAHNYICVTAKKPNGFQDANPTDNEICIGLKSNEFILPEPSPNPASDYITIPLIIPSDAEVELIIYDKLGQAVSDRLKYSAFKGFNTIKYYTNSLGDGVYSYEITYKSAKAVKKFVKFRN